MSVAGTSIHAPAEAATRRRPPVAFRAKIETGWNAAAQSWAVNQPPGPTTIFQTAEWLTPFYGALAQEGGAEPLIATISDMATGELAMRLPLLRRRRGRLRVIEFADLDLTDYNAPVLGPAAPTTLEGAKAAFKALKAAMPPADLIRLVKMPPQIAGRPNPLSLLAAAKPSSLFGQPLTVGDDFTAHRFSMPREFRKELERSWRVFTRHEGAAFRDITDPADALRILDEMAAQQRARLDETGQDYRLDDPMPATFYRDLVADGIPAGYVSMTVLTVGDELIAGMIGLKNENAFLIIRLTNAGKDWAKISPGRLLIIQTMEYLHEKQGYRMFDFSIGDYPYKRRFGLGRAPLLDMSVATSARGVPAMLRARLAAWLRERPELDRKVRDAIDRLRRR